MILQSEYVRLPIDESWFQQSLAETIVWCTSLPIEIDPHESTGIQHRRELGQKAGELYRRAHLSNWPELIKKIEYWRANRMFARARLLEIAPLSAQLRSQDLQPESFFQGRCPEKRSEIVARVVALRAEKLQSEKRSPTQPTSDLAGGKLLLFAPEDSVLDGAAQYASKGFFDVDNVPPWDTWICFVEKYVVCWVPPQLLELADSGVNADPVQSLLWA